MATVKTKTLKTKSGKLLPQIARRLMEENRQRRIKISETGGNFRGNLKKTVSYLNWKAECNSLSEAIHYIASELDRERIYALYCRLFPNEWRKSTASFTKIGENEYHTEREFEFITLVNHNYFPFSTWLDWSDYRFDHIPIEGVNLDLCCGEFEWEEFRPCLRFAVAAFLWRGGGIYDWDWNEILSSFNLQLEDLPPINHENPPYRELEKQRDNPKIQRFLHLIEFIYHDTGNPFIDTTCCQPMELFEWTQENLEKLKTEYKAVQAYFESMDSLDKDIERNALKTFKEMISLWNTGHLPSKNIRKEAADNSDDSSALLINILANSDGTTESILTL